MYTTQYEVVEGTDDRIRILWKGYAMSAQYYYKSYEPASKSDNWFRGAKYDGLDIYKFRCKNPKRCFGYRKNDVFHVLRMERDHKISDNG